MHARIMQSLLAAHAELETCLGEVLALEGWDPATLAMPGACASCATTCWS